jgi:uncharacterized protein
MGIWLQAEIRPRACQLRQSKAKHQEIGHVLFTDMSSQRASDRLIVFLKNPNREKVKTRLANGVGHELANFLYRRLLGQTLRIALASGVGVDFYATDRCWIFPDMRKHQKQLKGCRFYTQKGIGLGERMTQAFQNSFRRAYRYTVLIGSDCPTLTVTDLQKAFRMLRKNDLVIGPASDGGYYLLGLSRMAPLFSGIIWSRPNVFRRTLARADRLHLRTGLLPIRRDLDTVRDLTPAALEAMYPCKQRL